MRLRNAVPRVAVVLLLAILAAFAWFTRHPDDPRWTRAEHWPVVGPVVAKLRAVYLDDGAEEGSASARAPAPVLVPAGPPGASEPGTAEDAETLWLPPGTAIRAEPRFDAPLLGGVERFEHLPALRRIPASPLEGETRPAYWYVVLYRERLAWVRVVEPVPGEPPLGRAPAPVTPLPPIGPDPKRLALALDLLGTDGPSGRVGPYPLYTDVTDPYVLQRLSAVAAQIEPLYRQRYGLDLVGEPAEVVVLFAREAGYRAFQQTWESLAGLPAAGHTGQGIVAFYVEGREHNEMVSTLVHELVHLLNRRALGPALPPWLDEGLAQDLTWSDIDPTGRVSPGTWGGDRIEKVERDERRHAVITDDVVTGGLAVYQTLPRFAETLRIGRALPLDRLLDLDWDDFVHTDRQLHYLESGLLVRFLLEDRELGPRFRRFLRDTAEGRPLTPERFQESIGLSWEELYQRLETWVEAEAVG